MNLMDLKVWREVKTQKLRSILIIGIVAITLSMVIGMRAGYPMMIATYEENLRQSNVADGRFTFASPMNESDLKTLKEDTEFLSQNKIDRLEGRLIMRTDLIYNDKPFPVILIGIKYPNQVNQVYIEEAADDIDQNSDFMANTTNIIIESRFAGSLLGQDMSLNEEISISFQSEDIGMRFPKRNPGTTPKRCRSYQRCPIRWGTGSPPGAWHRCCWHRTRPPGRQCRRRHTFPVFRRCMRHTPTGLPTGV